MIASLTTRHKRTAPYTDSSDSIVPSICSARGAFLQELNRRVWTSLQQIFDIQWIRQSIKHVFLRQHDLVVLSLVKRIVILAENI